MDNLGFSYSFRQSARAKRLRLNVYPDARVVITAPSLVSERTILNFVSHYADWIRLQLAKQTKSGGGIFLPGGRRDYLKNKERARSLAREMLGRHNQTYGLVFNRIAIKNLYRNWGSCSVKRNLNFNYKIVHLPSHLAEYIVVHELCHLKEMNHSQRFWALVAKTVPDYKKRRQELKKFL
ncbi:MAG: SprT family zinc-dependent metalloprotease, partial [Patescibacteria group bacterium]